VSGPFHPGEREVQRRAGVAEEAQAVGRIVARSIGPAVARFLATQRLAVAATMDAAGRPWASLLTGPAGFVAAIEERLLLVASDPAPDDPLVANLRARPELGLLVFDPRTRQRVRLNGRAMQAAEGIFLETDQVYGNCPKYIQKRRLVGEDEREESAAVRSAGLDARQRDWIAGADTFFIASYHAEGGADASHRGGRPGFVEVLDARHLAFPDYAGNTMFNTLGNLAEYPRAGLLFVDFAAGGVLQITGRSALELGGERRVSVEVEEVVEAQGRSRLRWELVESSPANPLDGVTPAARAASEGA
jgi:predicted pyridoxine 5'-phosphate oxidase superfamily flavin-nucleotide-binding protein